MNHLQHNKDRFKLAFHNTISEQSEIRKSLIGQSLAGIFYTPKVEGWDIDIKDQTVIHVPYGYLTIESSSGEIFRINTTYQTWCGGIFGITLEKISINETHNPTTVPLNNFLTFDSKWKDIQNKKIEDVEWHWKREPNCKLDKKVLTLGKVQKYIFEDCFAPENLVFHFENDKKVCFFCLEPDEEDIHRQTYKLLSGGEEIMIFLDPARFYDWGITSLGFQIKPK